MSTGTFNLTSREAKTWIDQYVGSMRYILARRYECDTRKALKLNSITYHLHLPGSMSALLRRLSSVPKTSNIDNKAKLPVLSFLRLCYTTSFDTAFEVFCTVLGDGQRDLQIYMDAV
jgi:hypothetical protein